MNPAPETVASQGNSPRAQQLAGDTLQFTTFHLNSEIFGLNILEVQEIQLPQDITPVPRSQAHILGLISLRGNIVTLIDLRRRLGMDCSRPIEDPYHIVVNTPYTIASFEVEEIGDVIDVAPEEFLPPPESVRAVDARFLAGVFSWNHKIVAVLNVDAVLETA